MSDAPKKRARRASRRAKRATPKLAAAEAPETFGGRERVYAFADSVDAVEGAREGDEQEEVRLETWVAFRLAGETFALPVSAVQEIVRVAGITRVPHAPYTVRGVINLRGRVVPVVDLRVRIGLPPADVSPSSRILVTSTRGRLLGLLVDAVDQVVRLDRNQVEPAPPDVMTAQSEYLLGVYHLERALLILLVVEPLLLVPDSLQAGV